MRHPVPVDLEWIDDIVDHWPCTVRWDVKGHTPSAPSLAARLWDGVATQRVATDDGGRPVGLFQLVDLHLLHGTARIEAIVSPGDVAEPWRTFVVQAAAAFPLRSVQVFTVADGFDVGTVEPAAREVGRLPDHHLRGVGHYEDLVIHEVDIAAVRGRRGAAAAAPR